jgi:muconolactone delta-isomerase
MVERHLPGITSDQLSAAAARAKSTTAQMSEEGTPIRYLRSTFVPGEEKCYCLFDGPSADAVEQANKRADIPYERVVEAMHIASEDLS